MVTKALIEGSIKGVGKLRKTSIFPCGIFQCMKGVNRKPGDPNYDLFKLALKSTAQRLYPNYANVDWSGNAGYDINDPRTYFSTMGCRTANGWDVNGLGQRKDGRGNICPVTIILPTLAMIAKNQTNNLLAYKMLEDDNETKLIEIEQKVKCQITKFQLCVGCHACENSCRFNAIKLIKLGQSDSEYGYEISENKCIHCFQCIDHYPGGCYMKRVLQPRGKNYGK
jgi:anaerobic ribonucleoside-triphosphate reductase